MERDKIIETLLQNFLKVLLTSLKPFQTLEERVDYLETLINYLKGVYSHEDAIPEYDIPGNPFDGEAFIRQNILFKYRDKAKPFVDTGLRYYFEKEPGLKAHLFESLKLTAPVLTDEEYDFYIHRVYNILHTLIEKICVKTYETAVSETETHLNALPESKHPNKGKYKSNSQEYTRKRQVILYYFILKLMGTSRGNADLIDMVEFAHALFGFPTDNAKNGGLYKLIEAEPRKLYKDVKNYLTDLMFVKHQFERINHSEGSALVQKEIDALKRQ